MEILRLILLFVHILGFAALLGGALAQLGEGERRVNAAMRDGVGVAFLAGMGLVGVLVAGDAAVDHAKIGVKLAIGAVLLELVMSQLRKPRLTNGRFYTILALSVVNVAVAVFWSPAHT